MPLVPVGDDGELGPSAISIEVSPHARCCGPLRTAQYLVVAQSLLGGEEFVTVRRDKDFRRLYVALQESLPTAAMHAHT